MMKREQAPPASTVVVCCVASGVLGGLLGWILKGHPTLALLTLGLVLLGGALAWWKFTSSVAARWRLRRALTGVEGFQWQIVLGLMTLAGVSLVVTRVVFDQEWGALLLNLGTELIGAAATYALFEMIIARREERQKQQEALQAEKEELIARMGSRAREVAVPASEELRRRRWLTDGSLRGAYLTRADLSEASLFGADLRRAYLSKADLHGSDLSHADLSEANLSYADLRGAILDRCDLRGSALGGAKLQNAYLSSAKLQGARLRGADLEDANLLATRLQGADLSEANLKGCYMGFGYLAQAKNLAGVMLPDGTKLSEDNWKTEFEEWRDKRNKEGRGD